MQLVQKEIITGQTFIKELPQIDRKANQILFKNLNTLGNYADYSIDEIVNNSKNVLIFILNIKIRSKQHDFS